MTTAPPAECFDRLPRLAGRVVKRLPSTMRLAVFEDLVNEGAVALLQAWATFDPNRGCAFRTYGTNRAYGAMLDWLRWSRWHTRNHRPGVDAITDHQRETWTDPAPSADAVVLDAERVAFLDRWIAQGGRHGAVLAGKRHGTNADVAASLDISEGRVSQIWRALLPALQAQVRNERRRDYP